MKKGQYLKELLHVENEFFDLDHNKKIAYMHLEFDKPSDIFDLNSKTKLPVLSDDFMEWIASAFDYAPKKYKIDLDVSFTDMEGFDNDTLQAIFKKNMMLEFKKNEGKAHQKNRIANSLIVIGIVFFVAMLLITNLWQDGGLLRDIFKYVADIATTVTFWEAMTILVVENKERTSYMKDLLNRFYAIRFGNKNFDEPQQSD